MDIKDVVIIGAGPAGIATAIQLRRYNIKPLLLEKKAIGGLLRNAHLVENYPGFPEGISGLDLVELFKEQLKNACITVNFEEVVKLEYGETLFFTKTNRREIESSIVVIATGTKPKKISNLFISNGIKNRIFYEIVPILGTENKKIAIIGGGDLAFDYAFNLSQKNEVVICNRSDRIKCIPVLQERCLKSENISYLFNVDVSEINKEANKIILTYLSDSQKENQISVDYLIVAIGREPSLEFLNSKLKKNFEKQIKGNKLYTVGDIQNDFYRQTAICVGDGVKAAMKIHRIIRREKP